MFERYSFVAITTKDLSAARRFWVEQLGFRVTEESPSEFFIVDAGGLRLCVDAQMMRFISLEAQIPSSG
jgi:catechol 2,3-dioxygenase-like lactoylglutathione lyase family enzyme